MTNLTHQERLLGLAHDCEALTPMSAERDELGVQINEAMGIASYITDDGDPCLSIDAALTLIPDGSYPTLDFVAVRCWLRTAEGFDLPGGLAYGCGSTIPLAICAAALRALSHKDTGHA